MFCLTRYNKPYWLAASEHLATIMVFLEDQQLLYASSDVITVIQTRSRSHTLWFMENSYSTSPSMLWIVCSASLQTHWFVWAVSSIKTGTDVSRGWVFLHSTFPSFLWLMTTQTIAVYSPLKPDYKDVKMKLHFICSYLDKLVSYKFIEWHHLL